MKVTTSHHIDADEPDEQGFYSYYYEYDIYRFSNSTHCYVIRCYADEPDTASFVSRDEGKRQKTVVQDHLTDPLLVEAIKYLRALGKTTFKMYCGPVGYSMPIDPKLLP